MTDDKLAAALADHGTRARILIVDIERLPGMTPIFDQRTRGFIPVAKWTRLPSLLCFAAKWHGKRAVEFHAAWNDHAAMVQRAWELYDAADIVVTYNGVRFDNKHLRSEWAVAGMVPPRPHKDVDLFALNKRLFGFESKSLDHLCSRLGLNTKSGHYDPEQAEACMNGDTKAQRLMRRYNVGDVKITEQAYDRLLAWQTGHPHVSLATDNGTPICNRCATTDLADAGEYVAAQLVYPQYRCNGCGGLVRGTVSIRRLSRTRAN